MKTCKKDGNVSFTRLASKLSVLMHLKWMLNSIIYASFGALLGTLFAAMCGYALAKYRFPGRELIFNTVLGEELLFRGLLLPRMNRAFGRGDWAANGVLFAAYHVATPWMMPATVLIDTFAIAYPAKRYQSAWIGIAVHSAQSVFIAAILLGLVL